MERTRLKQWIGTLGCAEDHGGFTFLRDPVWSVAEQDAAARQMEVARGASHPDKGWLCIRTGGSGGGLKFARHDEATFSAAVTGFCDHFGLRQVNAVGVLPAWHISGLMARLRCAETGGRYVDCDWRSLAAGELPALPRDQNWVLSLVPTQLQVLLGHPNAVDWLQRFAVIFLGGGPSWAELTGSAAGAGLRVALSYGMTETAAMVTTQRPDEFSEGDRSAGRPMPHVQIRTDPEGRIVIAAESLFRGYFPETRTGTEFVTQDLGRIDEGGRLHVLGRIDAVIITGGKKVQPLEVEAALRASGEFDDVAVIGVPDPKWGEAVVACYPAGARTPDENAAIAALAHYQRPKRFVPIAAWPRNAQGKINRAALVALVTGL